MVRRQHGGAGVDLTRTAGTLTFMPGDREPGFDEWVDYCFTRGYSDFHADWEGPDAAELEAREDRFLRLDPPLLASHMIKLLESPEFIVDRYADDQIGDAVWFLFGVASGYFHDLRSEALDLGTQVACLRSVESF